MNISSPAATRAAGTPRLSIACWAPLNSTDTIPKLICARYSRESPNIRSSAPTSCCLGTCCRRKHFRSRATRTRRNSRLRLSRLSIRIAYPPSRRPRPDAYFCTTPIDVASARTRLTTDSTIDMIPSLSKVRASSSADVSNPCRRCGCSYAGSSIREAASSNLPMPCTAVRSIISRDEGEPATTRAGAAPPKQQSRVTKTKSAWHARNASTSSSRGTMRFPLRDLRVDHPPQRAGAHRGSSLNSLPPPPPVPAFRSVGQRYRLRRQRRPATCSRLAKYRKPEGQRHCCLSCKHWSSTRATERHSRLRIHDTIFPPIWEASTSGERCALRWGGNGSLARRCHRGAD